MKGLVCFLCLAAFARGSEVDLHGLKGLNTVLVIAGPLDEDAKKLGLAEGDLQTDIELRLRSQGISVGAGTHAETIYVAVTLTRDLAAAEVEIMFLQKVYLERNFAPGVAATWSDGTVVAHPTARGIRDHA